MRSIRSLNCPFHSRPSLQTHIHRRFRSQFSPHFQREPSLLTYANEWVPQAKGSPSALSDTINIVNSSANWMNHLLLQIEPAAYHALIRRMFHLKDIVPLPADNMPKAPHYFHIFKSFACMPSSYWEPVKTPNLIIPGDIISYAPMTETYTPFKRGMSNEYHVMLVKDNVSPNDPNLTRRNISVLDFAPHPHSKDFDSRSGRKSGVGASMVHLNFNPKSSTIQWAPNSQRISKQFAIARVKSAFSPETEKKHPPLKIKH